MEGDSRRTHILETLIRSEVPCSGTELAKKFGVSRQVIVQDIALLRATDKNILSTNKGYVLYDPIQHEKTARRSIHVHHADSQIRDELYTIVDYGGTVRDVVVEHDVYGQITVDLILKNRRDVDDFVVRLEEKPAKPLKELTGGTHYHTVEAESEAVLDGIEQELKRKGYLC